MRDKCCLENNPCTPEMEYIQKDTYPFVYSIGMFRTTVQRELWEDSIKKSTRSSVISVELSSETINEARLKELLRSTGSPNSNLLQSNSVHF